MFLTDRNYVASYSIKQPYHPTHIRCKPTSISTVLLGGWSLRVMLAALDILRPIANILRRIEDQICRARHVMLALPLAHVIVRTVRLVRMVADVAVLFLARHLVGCCVRNNCKRLHIVPF